MAREHPENSLLLSQFEVKNLGPIRQLKADKLGRINLILGENSCGKTFLLKMLYVACKSMESYKRGKEISTLHEIVKNKIYWTFQAPSPGCIVSRSERKCPPTMEFSCSTVSRDQIKIALHAKGTLHAEVNPEPSQRALSKTQVNSVFLPAKEVLSNHSLIVSTRDDLRVFGFDDTYYDLAKVLTRPAAKGKSYHQMAAAGEAINDIFKAKATYNEDSYEWVIQKGGNVYAVNEVSEGIKKLSILGILLGNRYIGPGSIIFIDEPESALHPAAVSRFMDAIHRMSLEGIQFFMATHSYFVVKKLASIAKKNHQDIPFFSYQSLREEETTLEWQIGNLATDGIDNPIIRESVRLYRDEITQFLHD